MTMNAVLLSGDLMVISAGDGVARRCGSTLMHARSAEAAVAQCAGGNVALLAVDLRTAALDVAKFVADVRSQAPAVRVLAFGPHVHEALLAAAAAAGCDETATRGQFELRFEAALRRER